MTRRLIIDGNAVYELDEEYALTNRADKENTEGTETTAGKESDCYKNHCCNNKKRCGRNNIS